MRRKIFSVTWKGKFDGREKPLEAEVDKVVSSFSHPLLDRHFQALQAQQNTKCTERATGTEDTKLKSLLVPVIEYLSNSSKSAL